MSLGNVSSLEATVVLPTAVDVAEVDLELPAAPVASVGVDVALQQRINSQVELKLVPENDVRLELVPDAPIDSQRISVYRGNLQGKYRSAHWLKKKQVSKVQTVFERAKQALGDLLGEQVDRANFNISHKMVTYKIGTRTYVKDVETLRMQDPQFDKTYQALEKASYKYYGGSEQHTYQPKKGAHTNVLGPKPLQRTGNEVLLKMAADKQGTASQVIAQFPETQFLEQRKKLKEEGLSVIAGEKKEYQEIIMKRIALPLLLSHHIAHGLEEKINDIAARIAETDPAKELTAAEKKEESERQAELMALKTQVEGLDHYAISIAAAYMPEDSTRIAWVEGRAKYVKDLVTADYKQKHDAVQRADLREWVPNPVAKIPVIGPLLKGREKQIFFNKEYATDVAALVFSPVDCLEAREPYARFCTDQGLPIKDAAPEEVFVRAAVLGIDEKERFKREFFDAMLVEESKELKEILDAAMKEAGDALTQDKLTAAAGTTLVERWTALGVSSEFGL